ncbi:MAG: hypothetical protein CMH55_06990 [Myxococcales bacterium]|nr:hypothetical protein [Myxococcales bacterium]|tara:strand:- start:1984 stop:2712 length:729 start_codon:yes stop_codon:yes gene_type:complete
MPVYVLLLLAATPSTLGLDGGMALDSDRWGPGQNPAALSLGRSYLYMGGAFRQLDKGDYTLGLGAVDAVSGPVAGSLGLLVSQPDGSLIGETGLGLLLSPQLAAGLAVVKPNEDWSHLSARTGVALVQGPMIFGVHYDFSVEELATPWTFSGLYRGRQGGFRASLDLQNDLSSRLGILLERQRMRLELGGRLDAARSPRSYAFAIDYLEKGGWLGLAYRRDLESQTQFIGFRFAAQLRRRSP